MKDGRRGEAKEPLEVTDRIIESPILHDEHGNRFVGGPMRVFAIKGTVDAAAVEEEE